MSRIGRKPIPIPAGVKVSWQNNTFHTEGPKGKLSLPVHPAITLDLSANLVQVKPLGTDKKDRALHGLSRALINNAVTGVSTGFTKKLEIQGVGFKAALKGKTLVLNLGFSHPINYEIPEGITITITDAQGKKVTEGTFITIEGTNKETVGAVAAKIRGYYPPEPYKGKGVRFVGEQIRRKEGKTAQSK
jgi:large subunit ribosomal protein L6